MSLISPLLPLCLCGSLLLSVFAAVVMVFMFMISILQVYVSVHLVFLCALKFHKQNYIPLFRETVKIPSFHSFIPMTAFCHIVLKQTRTHIDPLDQLHRNTSMCRVKLQKQLRWKIMTSTSKNSTSLNNLQNPSQRLSTEQHVTQHMPR